MSDIESTTTEPETEAPSAPPASVFTAADATPEPEPQAPPGPAAQADAEPAAEVGDEDAEFDLDETPEERTRRLARERQAAKRERDAFKEWQTRQAADAADGRVLIKRDGPTEEQWRNMPRDPNPADLTASVITRTGRFVFEPALNGLTDAYRAAKTIALEYDIPHDLGIDGADLVSRLGSMSTGDVMLLPGSEAVIAREAAEQAATQAALDAKRARAQENWEAQNPEAAKANREHAERMQRMEEREHAKWGAS